MNYLIYIETQKYKKDHSRVIKPSLSNHQQR